MTTITTITDPRIANMDRQIELPRKNGELVFEQPWEARAFGIAVALNESGAYPWRDFSEGLAGEIAAAEKSGDASTYYERWLASLEKLLIERGLISEAEFAARIAEQKLHDAHTHDHDDHDHPHHDHPGHDHLRDALHGQHPNHPPDHSHNGHNH